MASPRIASPMRGVSYQLSRMSLRQDAVPKSLSSFARPITTSTTSQAAVSSITTSADGYVPVTPFEEQSVLATIHKFPSLEPLRLQPYPANYLNLPTRRDILHRAVIYEGDKTRLGTAHTKTRYEVRGSARKIRPQKGSGRARLGDKKSPMLKGGGVSHGPRFRDFSTDLPKKVYDRAWRTALSYRWRKGELIIVDNAIELESPSQRLLTHIFNLHDRERGHGRSLLVTSQSRPLLEQALEKMDRRRQALTWNDVDVKDLLELSRIIIERQALWKIFKNHRSDIGLSMDEFLPKYGLEHKPECENYYQSVPGWSQFCDLVSAPPAERETARVEAYESTAAYRYEHAESLPESHPEKLPLSISAFELIAEAKDLRCNLLPTVDSLRHAYEQKSEAAFLVEREQEGTLAAAQATLAAAEAKVAWLQNRLETDELTAQAHEDRREIFKFKGEVESAEEEEAKASDVRTDLEGTQGELLLARKEDAEAKAKVATLEEDFEEADMWYGEADAVQAQIDALSGEGEEEAWEQLGEEVEQEGQAGKEEVKKS